MSQIVPRYSPPSPLKNKTFEKIKETPTICLNNGKQSFLKYQVWEVWEVDSLLPCMKSALFKPECLVKSADVNKYININTNIYKTDRGTEEAEGQRDRETILEFSSTEVKNWTDMKKVDYLGR